MTRNQKFVSPAAETRGRCGRVVAGSFALAMLLPASAFAVDSPRMTTDGADYGLPLPPIRYLDSMRWMDWKPSAPAFKVDTLLLPDNTQPGVFRLPSDYERNLPRVS
jgi:hypothetical protein